MRPEVAQHILLVSLSDDELYEGLKRAAVAKDKALVKAFTEEAITRILQRPDLYPPLATKKVSVMTALPAAQTAKCSYFSERWAVLNRIGILVGQVCHAANWACGDGSLPFEGDLEFNADQLRRVCSFHLQELTLHAHEWAAQPLWIHGYNKEGPCRIP